MNIKEASILFTPLENLGCLIAYHPSYSCTYEGDKEIIHHNWDDIEYVSVIYFTSEFGFINQENILKEFSIYRIKTNNGMKTVQFYRKDLAAVDQMTLERNMLLTLRDEFPNIVKDKPMHPWYENIYNFIRGKYLTWKFYRIAAPRFSK